MSPLRGNYVMPISPDLLEILCCPRSKVAVQMLSEGWDARNVTHIMGLRAFSSQLLCEQVVGRGLRRTSYDVDPETGLYSPEYVNVFGIPFTFLPHEGGEGTPPPPTASTTSIEPDPEKIEHKISWPNIERIDTDFKPELFCFKNSYLY